MAAHSTSGGCGWPICIHIGLDSILVSNTVRWSWRTRVGQIRLWTATVWAQGGLAVLLWLGGRGLVSLRGVLARREHMTSKEDDTPDVGSESSFRNLIVEYFRARDAGDRAAPLIGSKIGKMADGLRLGAFKEIYASLESQQRTELARFLHVGSFEEASFMPAPKTEVVLGQTESKPTSSLRQDLIHVGISLIPGVAVLAVGLVLNPSFVAAGWPLFAILGLGLFAGSLATLSSINASRSN